MKQGRYTIFYCGISLIWKDTRFIQRILTVLGCIRELTKGVVTGQVDPLPYVFYKEAEYLVNDVDDTYTGYMPQYSAPIPRFHVIVNTSCNEMSLSSTERTLQSIMIVRLTLPLPISPGAITRNRINWN